MRGIVVGLVVAFIVAVPASSALTRPSAMKAAQRDAAKKFTGAIGGQVFQTSYCKGPYGNTPGKTQWACFGIGVDAIHKTHWRIHLGPNGRVLYAKLYL